MGKVLVVVWVRKIERKRLALTKGKWVSPPSTSSLKYMSIVATRCPPLFKLNCKNITYKSGLLCIYQFPWAQKNIMNFILTKSEREKGNQCKHKPLESPISIKWKCTLKAPVKQMQIWGWAWISKCMILIIAEYDWNYLIWEVIMMRPIVLVGFISATFQELDRNSVIKF